MLRATWGWGFVVLRVIVWLIHGQSFLALSIDYSSNTSIVFYYMKWSQGSWTSLWNASCILRSLITAIVAANEGRGHSVCVRSIVRLHWEPGVQALHKLLVRGMFMLELLGLRSKLWHFWGEIISIICVAVIPALTETNSTFCASCMPRSKPRQVGGLLLITHLWQQWHIWMSNED